MSMIDNPLVSLSNLLQLQDANMAMILEHPQDLPAMYYRRIGAIAYRWNMIELYMQTLTWHYLGLDVKKGRLLTYWPGPVTKIKAFKALPERWVDDSKIAKEITAIATKADNLRIKRNNIVHGIWGCKPKNRKDRYLFEFETGKDRIFPRVKLTPQHELDNQADRLKKLQKRLVALHKRVGAPLP